MNTIDGVEIPEPMADYAERLDEQREKNIWCVREFEKFLKRKFHDQTAEAIRSWVYPCLETNLALSRICRLVLAFADQAVEKPYCGKYQGQRVTTGSRIHLDSEVQPVQR